MGDSFTIEPFLFLYSGKYEVEVEFSLLGEEETDTTNNSKLSRVVSVAPDPVDLAPCGRLLVDVVIVAAETLIGPGASGHAEMMIDLAEIAEKLINLIALGFACKKDGEYLTNEDVIECQLEAIDMLFDQMIKELANLFVEHGLATNMKNFLAKFGAKLIAHFILGLKHAVQCGWELGDVLIRLVKNIRNHGQDMSAVLVESPLNVLVTNSKGQRVGILADGSAVAEIEGSEVLVEGDVKILAYPGADTTSVALDGTGTGSFDLTVALSQPGTDQVQAASYTDVPISAASIGSVDLDGDFALNLDDDGDGVIDRRVAPSLPPSKDSAPGGGQGIVLIVLIIAVGAVALVVVANRRRQPAFPTPETSEPTRAQLIVVRGEQAGSVFPLGVSDLAIGRSQAAGLPLSHGRVSRRHAVIRYAQGRWFIQDQGSTHGTYVSGQRVEATALNPGDRITIGDTEFEFRIG
jgi:hypothetical protein